MWQRLLICLLTLIMCSLAAQADSIKIGLSAPLSGGGAGWGRDIENTLKFAIEKLAAGQYKVIAEDDRCDPKTSLTIANKLISVDQIKYVFVVCGQTALATSATYKKKDVIALATLATPSRLSGLGFYRTSLSDAYAADRLARVISQKHGKVAVLTEENDYPKGFLEDFQKSAKVLGLEVENQDYLPGDLDFRSQLLRLKSQHTEAVFVNTQTEEALAAILQQMKDLQFKPALFGAYLPGSANFLKNSGALAEGLVFVDFPSAKDLLTPEGQELYQQYTAKFGAINGWEFAFPATFEAFRVLHQAIQSGQPIHRYIDNQQFNGIFGKYHFDDQGDLVGFEHVLKVVENKVAKPLP